MLINITMDDKKIYPVEEVKEGEYMVWSVCSQTASRGLIVLRDDEQIYDTVSKDNTSTELQDLTKGTKGAFYGGGGNLRFEVTIHDALRPQLGCKSINGIIDGEARIVGHTVNICIEDYNDNDYNDYYITFAAWQKKG